MSKLDCEHYIYASKILIMKNLRLLNLLCISFLILLSSCGAVIKSYIRKDTENVPPDLGKEKTTMLIIQERKGYNKKVEKVFKEYYEGDYVFVTREELETKYKDESNYRYIFDDDISISKYYVTTVTTDRSTGFQKRTTTPRSSASRSFHIIDRKTNKIHDTGVSSGTSWKKILKTYLQKLDAERKKNGGK
jgi:hypothetical protein